MSLTSHFTKDQIAALKKLIADEVAKGVAKAPKAPKAPQPSSPKAGTSKPPPNSPKSAGSASGDNTKLKLSSKHHYLVFNMTCGVDPQAEVNDGNVDKLLKMAPFKNVAKLDAAAKAGKAKIAEGGKALAVAKAIMGVAGDDFDKIVVAQRAEHNKSLA